MRAFCRNSQLLDEKSVSIRVPIVRLPVGSWYTRKPVVAFHRYLRPFGQSTAQGG